MIHNKFYSDVLAIKADSINWLDYQLESMSKFAQEKGASIDDNDVYRVDRIYKPFRNVAVIDFKGYVTKGIPAWAAEYFGMCDLNDISAAFKRAQNDPSINTIVINFDSPGGAITGLDDVSNLLNQITESMEVHAYTEGVMCSAAYHVASQADIIAGTKTSVIGSIGTIVKRIDRTTMLNDEGIKVSIIRAGDLKGMGDPDLKLTEQELNAYQERIKYANDLFLEAVNRKRNIPESATQGQWFFAGQAFDAGTNLVDIITDKNIDDYVAELIA